MGNGEDEVIFVTDDQAIHKQGKIDEADAEVVRAAGTGEGLIAIESVEQLKAIGEGLVAAFAGCTELCRKNMTMEQASIIRGLRVDEGYSWRAIAHVCHDLMRWGPNEYWDRVPSAQPMGMALCEVAADLLDEDGRQPPWN